MQIVILAKNLFKMASITMLPDWSSTNTSKCIGLSLIQVITVPKAAKRQSLIHHGLDNFIITGSAYSGETRPLPSPIPMFHRGFRASTK